MYIPTLDDMKTARERIAPYIHRTPVLTSEFLNDLTGAELFLRCENVQKAGAFKVRGACNAVFGLPDDMLAKGVATHSSGNHALSLSCAAGHHFEKQGNLCRQARGRHYNRQKCGPREPAMDEADIQTPCLILDLDALDRNIKKMGVRHRAHGKMHKSVDVLKLQESLGGAIGVCCQKVSEAEVFMRGGIKDVLIARPCQN